jgi:hypothetical protein
VSGGCQASRPPLASCWGSLHCRARGQIQVRFYGPDLGLCRLSERGPTLSLESVGLVLLYGTDPEGSGQPWSVRPERRWPVVPGNRVGLGGPLARSASGRGAVTKVGGRSRRNGRPTGELISALGISESCSSQRSTDRRPTRTPRLGSLRPAPYKSNKRRWDPRCSAPRSQSQETRVRRHERHHRASRDRRIRPASGGPPRRGPYLSNR